MVFLVQHICVSKYLTIFVEDLSYFKRERSEFFTTAAQSRSGMQIGDPTLFNSNICAIF